MKNKSKEHPIVHAPIKPIEEPSSLVFQSMLDEKTGKHTYEMSLSNESRPPGSNSEELCAYEKKLEKSLQYTTGSTNSETAVKILEKVASGSKYETALDQYNNAAAILVALKPQDETEALLLGQFLNLQDTGNAFLHRAHLQDGFYHLERFSMLAVKMFNAANQTIQTLLKYRSRGQQVVQVVHVHNDGGQAIVAQNLSKNDASGGL